MLSWFLSSYLQQAARERILAAVQEAALGAREGKQATEGDPEKESEPPKPPPCQIAILCAHEAEAGGLIDLLEGPQSFQTAHSTEYTGRLADRQVVVVISGGGRAAATLAAEETIRLYQPEWVLAAGFASGLDPAVRRRHVIMPGTVIGPDGRTLSVGFQLDPALTAGGKDQRKSLHVGPLLTVEEPVAGRKEKEALAAQFTAQAVDTESFFIADACRAAKTRFLAVRAISDALDDALPPDVEILVRQKSLAGQIGAGIMAAWRRLGSVSDLWQLQEDAVKAGDTLARFVAGLLPQLVERPRAV